MVQLGKAVRHKEKSIRVATHEPVVKLICEKLKISYVVEDGMGLSSTPLFHSLKIENLLSFETRQEWATCAACNIDDITKHTIDIGKLSIDKIQNFICDNISKTLFFVDGLSTDERFQTLQDINTFKPIVIIEHDAEAINSKQMQQRKDLFAVDYNIYQFIDLNPETLLYIKNTTNVIMNNSSFIRL